MKTITEATHLAETMVGIGASGGVPVTAILTNMDQPLGQMVGNANEIIESIDVLRGEGPADVTALTTRFAAEMLVLTGTYSDDQALEKVRKVIDSGDAYELFLKLVERQGGDPASIENTKLLPSAPHTATITADRSGYIGRCDAYEVGLASVRLGAGRARKEDEVDPGVGLEISVKVGDEVNAGDTLAIMTYRDEARRASAQSVLGTTFVITDEPVARSELIMGEVR
jgi:thymidine phosphorylase